MPEAPVTPSPPAIPPTVVPAPGAENAPPQPATPPLILNRFKDVQALERADREITVAIGLPPLPQDALFGPGRLYPDAVAMESAYKQKEVILSKMKAPEKPATPLADPLKPGEPVQIKPPPVPPTPSAVPDSKGFDGLLKKAGLTKAELYTEFNKNGRLTEEQYTKAAAVGWDKDLTNEVVGAQVVAFQTQRADIRRQIDEAAGGEQKRDAVLAWAGTHYATKPEELSDLNQRLDDIRPGRAVGAMKQMVAEWKESNGSTNSNPVVNSGGPAPSSDSGALKTAKEFADIHAKIVQGSATPAEIARFNKTDPNIALR